jgi:tetratricopeptide (TPR) repeat protein
MLLAGSVDSVGLAAPTEAVPATPSALRAITPLPELLGLQDSSAAFANKERPLAERADEEWQALQRGIVAQAKQLTFHHSRSPVAWARLAQALHNNGEIEKAIEAARRVLALTGESSARLASGRLSPITAVDPAACYVAATVLAATGNSSEAEEALVLLPPNGEHRVVAAALAAERGDYTAALQRLEVANGGTAGALRAWLYLRIGVYDRALSELRRTAASGRPTPAVLTNMAFAYAVLGSLRKAIRAARHAVMLAPMSHTASFNLVGYLITAGATDSARAELDRLVKAIGHDDADIVLARAGTWLSDGEDRTALQTLKRGLQRVQLRGSARARAELRANVALLEGKLGIRSRSSVLVEIRSQVKRADGRSVTLVSMLCDLLSRTTAYPEIQALAKSLEPYHTTDQLLPLRARMAHLSANFDDAVVLMRQWTELEPMDPSAAANAVYLHGMYRGDYNGAAELGRAALRRTPRSAILRNNTACMLGLAGRGDDAQQVLSTLVDDNYPPLIATRGLAVMASGDLLSGIELYQQAARAAEGLADKPEAQRLGAQIALYQVLAVAILGLDPLITDDRKRDGILHYRLPADWEADPDFLLLRHVADRVGAGWPPTR